MKFISFLILSNVFLIVFVLSECVSIRRAVESLKAQQETIQIMVSVIYDESVKYEYNIDPVIRRNPKLKEKTDE